MFVNAVQDHQFRRRHIIPDNDSLLRSADTRTQVVGRTQSSFGDISTFAAAALRLWNNLLSDI